MNREWKADWTDFEGFLQTDFFGKCDFMNREWKADWTDFEGFLQTDFFGIGGELALRGRGRTVHFVS